MTSSPTVEAEPVKVLFAVDSLWVGGTERSLAEMLPHLAALGVEPVVACLRRRGEEGVEREVLAGGFDVRFLPGPGLGRQVRGLRRLLQEERPRILHSALFRANLVARLSAAGTPVLVVNSLVNTPYDPARRRDPRLKPWRLYGAQLLDAVTSRLLVDAFHSVTHAAKAAAVRSLGVAPERITVVERGRDPSRLGEPSPRRRLAARQALGLGEDAEVVVNVGRQEYQKDQRTLLEAAASLAPHRPRLVVLIAGRSGHASVELRALHRGLELGEGVRFLDHREDVAEVLAAADVFAFPSLFEGFPGAVLEAMALGLPIVASDIPPLREIVEPEGNGLLVAPQDPGLLAGAVATLLDHRATARAYGARSREIFEERFTLAHSVPAMMDFYRRLDQAPRRV